ncbi:hypothetical protein LG943_04800 [Streptomonospora sp. S1-112]|uniref:Uncharacterized protein n=1 Tax=Streptomonospora mangrovi TaxID=2883123 RepID=A0A9X3SCG9_9ACTN|nr:hypothetical protein [Streptomonospora mangrovi]MDA0563653.1 hypothetical protein [Streptomonospora mangrovi]
MSSPTPSSSPRPGGPLNHPHDPAAPGVPGAAGARDDVHAVGSDGTVTPGGTGQTGDAARHRAEDRYAAETGTRTPPTRATTIGSAERRGSARSGSGPQSTPAGGGATGSPPHGSPAGAEAASDGHTAAPVASDRAASTAPRGDGADVLTLFSEEDRKRFQDKWRDAQGDFVDDPRAAVHTADELVDEVLRTLTAKFTDHKRTLEAQWSHQGEADTETLRTAMRSYRTFFQQLLQTRN